MRQSILDTRAGVWRVWFSNDQAKLEKHIPPEVIAITGGSEIWANRDQILASARHCRRLDTCGVRRLDAAFIFGGLTLTSTYRPPCSQAMLIRD